MQHEPPDEPTKIRLHFVRWPAVGFPPIRAIVLTSALVSVLLISITLINFVMSHAFPDNRIGGSLRVMFISVPLSIALSLLIFSLHIRKVDDEYRRLRSHRWRRLCRVIERPELHFRYPHRLFEHAFYQSPQIPIRRSPFVRRCRPGDLLICNAMPPGDRHLPRSNDVAFEPIDLYLEPQRVMEYILTVDKMSPEDIRIHCPTPQKTRLRERTKLLVKKWIWRVLLIVGVLQCAFIASRTYSGGWGPQVYLPAFIITIGVLVVVRRLFFERRWWLTPGGLILREFRLWRSRMTVRLFTPETTPLVIDARSGVAYVINHGKAYRFDCGGNTWWALATAWTSSIQPPTMEQARLYVGE